MAKHDVKVDIELHFLRWKQADEPVPLALAGSDLELNSDTIFEGTISVSPTMLYNIIKEKKEADLIPVFEMVIPEDGVKQPEIPVPDKQEKLNFKNDPANSPVEDKAPPEKQPPKKKPVDKIPKVV